MLENFPVCHSFHTQWTRNFYIITARLNHCRITKATSSFCCVLAVIIHSSLVLLFNMLFKGHKNSLMTAIKWHINFERSCVTRAFAYSHLWQFTTINRANKRKMREKIIKENSLLREVQRGGGMGCGGIRPPGAQVQR